MTWNGQRLRIFVLKICFQVPGRSWSISNSVAMYCSCASGTVQQSSDRPSRKTSPCWIYEDLFTLPKWSVVDVCWKTMDVAAQYIFKCGISLTRDFQQLPQVNQRTVWHNIGLISISDGGTSELKRNFYTFSSSAQIYPCGFFGMFLLMRIAAY